MAAEVEVKEFVNRQDPNDKWWVVYKKGWGIIAHMNSSEDAELVKAIFTNIEPHIEITNNRKTHSVMNGNVELGMFVHPEHAEAFAFAKRSRMT